MDIVEQLRRDAYAPHFTSVGAANLMIAAADEIDRLRGSTFETLARLDGVALDLLRRIDSLNLTEGRESYADGYAGGLRDAVQAMRQFVVDECPDLHERVAMREKKE